MSILATLQTMIERDGQAVLVTIQSVKGSSPREAGVRMVVRADGAFSGTIGGGKLEWQVLAEAQALLAGGTVRLRMMDKILGPDLGQCCGGRVKLMLERLDRTDLPWLAPLARMAEPLVTIGRPDVRGAFIREVASETEVALLDSNETSLMLADGRLLERFGARLPPIYLFGAGHVGRALVLALAALPFDIIWCDPRPEAFPSHAPQRVRIMREPEPERILATAPDDASIVVMTHSHALDLSIAITAVSARRFAYVGVIGSQTKRARFISQMRQFGLDEAQIGQMICPIGIPGIDGKEPSVIAASVVAQILLLQSQRLASAHHLPESQRSVGENRHHGA